MALAESQQPQQKRGMYVIKRSGLTEEVHFDKITSRIKKLCFGLDPETVDPTIVSQKVCAGVYKGVTTVELDELAAETAAHLTGEHPDYGLLAARIAVSNLHKETAKHKAFSVTMKMLHDYVLPKTGEKAPKISSPVWAFIQKHAAQLDSALVHDRDYDFDYFGFKTLERSYLLKIDGRIVERPQHMYMRVACGIHCGNVEAAIETYNLLSLGWFTHASPTLFNAGTPSPQLSSCFLLTIKEDSIDGIYSTLKDCAIISKYAGGIGLAVQRIRATGSYIRGTNGESNGLVPMLRVFNNTARYVDQGGGKRKGSIAVYLEPWHADIFQWLELRKNHGSEEHRARDLFTGLWNCDLFMERVEQDGWWSLFCPNEAKGLDEVWGDKFKALYEKYEQQQQPRKLARKVVKARELWQAILESQIETGTPYMLYKDACNSKSNHQHLGTIHSSNLCTEIIQYHAPNEIAVCNLSSIALPKFVDLKSRTFDHQALARVVGVAVRNLNKLIDINLYPVPETRYSNLRHRPMGLGVQGLADAFILMRYPFESPEAQQLNREIFETIYYAALKASMELAKVHGTYETYKGSPISQGKLQFDLWRPDQVKHSGRWNWDGLKAEIKEHGVYNSLLVAPMPTATTSQILGNNECFEPLTSNIYVRRTLAGEFVCVNKHLLRDLVRRKLWTPALKNKLIAHNGSVQALDLPADLKALYKTVWEMKGKTLIDMAVARGVYIDQSQSLNVHMTDVNYGKLSSMHFYAWKSGLKTGMYYLRTKAAADAIKFTVEPSIMMLPPAQQHQKLTENKNQALASVQEIKHSSSSSSSEEPSLPPLSLLSPGRSVSPTSPSSPSGSPEPPSPMAAAAAAAELMEPLKPSISKLDFEPFKLPSSSSRAEAEWLEPLKPDFEPFKLASKAESEPVALMKVPPLYMCARPGFKVGLGGVEEPCDSCGS